MADAGRRVCGVPRVRFENGLITTPKDGILAYENGSRPGLFAENRFLGWHDLFLRFRFWPLQIVNVFITIGNS